MRYYVTMTITMDIQNMLVRRSQNFYERLLMKQSWNFSFLSCVALNVLNVNLAQRFRMRTEQEKWFQNCMTIPVRNYR